MTDSHSVARHFFSAIQAILADPPITVERAIRTVALITVAQETREAMLHHLGEQLGQTYGEIPPAAQAVFDVLDAPSVYEPNLLVALLGCPPDLQGSPDVDAEAYADESWHFTVTDTIKPFLGKLVEASASGDERSWEATAEKAVDAVLECVRSEVVEWRAGLSDTAEQMLHPTPRNAKPDSN